MNLWLWLDAEKVENSQLQQDAPSGYGGPLGAGQPGDGAAESLVQFLGLVMNSSCSLVDCLLIQILLLASPVGFGRKLLSFNIPHETIMFHGYIGYIVKYHLVTDRYFHDMSMIFPDLGRPPASRPAPAPSLGTRAAPGGRGPVDVDRVGAGAQDPTGIPWALED